MLWQDRDLSYDVGVALGLFLALIVCAPAYLVAAAVRRVAAGVGDAFAPALRIRGPAHRLRAWASGA